MKQPISEILKSISALPENQRQDALASCYQNAALVQSLKYVYDPNIVFLLPEGTPEGLYKPNQFIDQETNLYTEWRRMYLFVKGGNDSLPQRKRETLWVQLLEFIHPEDAKYLSGMKDKKMIYPGITEELVRRTFPGLLPGPAPSSNFTLTKLPKETKVKEVKEKIDPLVKNNAKIYRCPFGCTSIYGSDETYSKGNIKIHMKNKHQWTDEQVEVERNQQMIRLQARAG